jgi:hypothetical protein
MRIVKLRCAMTCILFLALPPAVPAAAQCLDYWPKVVRLSGRLVSEIHPGRPNYDSVTKGDEQVTIWVIRLNGAICVRGTNEIDVSEDGQTEIQLVLEQGQYNKYRGLLGQVVTVTGRLFHSHTGHHYKRLLLATDEIAIEP